MENRMPFSLVLLKFCVTFDAGAICWTEIQGIFVFSKFEMFQKDGSSLQFIVKNNLFVPNNSIYYIFRDRVADGKSLYGDISVLFRYYLLVSDIEEDTHYVMFFIQAVFI